MGRPVEMQQLASLQMYIGTCGARAFSILAQLGTCVSRSGSHAQRTELRHRMLNIVPTTSCRTTFSTAFKLGNGKHWYRPSQTNQHLMTGTCANRMHTPSTPQTSQLEQKKPTCLIPNISSRRRSSHNILCKSLPCGLVVVFGLKLIYSVIAGKSVNICVFSNESVLPWHA